MAAEPKRRHSRQRKGKRRASISLSIPNGVVCSNCNKMILGHSVCKYCGYYRGHEIVSKSKKETTTTPATNV
jgi:large subunit ribosomal protein L32